MFDSVAIDEVGGYFHVWADATTAWVHSVMVYHGFGVGITGYLDGRKIGTDTEKQAKSRKTGSGNLVIGKRNLIGEHYATASVDEIKMYNQQLTQQEICAMY